MFQTKKMKIKKYLKALPTQKAFDEILGAYMDGTLKIWMDAAGMTRMRTRKWC